MTSSVAARLQGFWARKKAAWRTCNGHGDRSASSLRSALIASAAALALWALDVPLGPVHAWLVGLHELFHAIAAVATGGSVEMIQTSSDAGGMTLSRGGIYPLISMSGYVGTGALGALCLRHCGSAWARAVLLGMCAALVAALLATTRSGWGGAAQALGVSCVVFWLVKGPAGALATGFCGALLLSMGLSDARVLVEAPSQTDAGLLAAWLGDPWLAWPIALGLMATMATLWCWALWGLSKDGRSAMGWLGSSADRR